MSDSHPSSGTHTHHPYGQRAPRAADSPAYALVEQAAALMHAIAQEFDADWFDRTQFTRRVDRMIEQGEQLLQEIHRRDPTYNIRPLRNQLRDLMQRRLREV